VIFHSLQTRKRFGRWCALY